MHETMKIPEFPEFAPIDLELRPEMFSLLSKTPDGVSEYTFSNLYLFRKKYEYKVSRSTEKNLILSGTNGGQRFFMTPCATPGRSVLVELFDTHDYWKGIPDSVLSHCRACLECRGIDIAEDRNNFDYLYLRNNLAELPGRKYHKKRNLVRAFTSSYQKYEGCMLTKELVPDALSVLKSWEERKGVKGDYEAAREALELFDVLEMQGAIYYVNDRPAGWCLGESLARGKMFAVHFEKAIEDYKGIYQYINQAFAASLPMEYRSINREQDLGDEGLRQAKMSYRPSGFVRKYIGRCRRPCDSVDQS